LAFIGGAYRGGGNLLRRLPVEPPVSFVPLGFLRGFLRGDLNQSIEKCHPAPSQSVFGVRHRFGWLGVLFVAACRQN
jgi:hypothetical protein